MVWCTCRLANSLSYRRNDLNLTCLVWDVIPDEAIAALQAQWVACLNSGFRLFASEFAYLTHTLAIDKEFAFSGIGVCHNWKGVTSIPIPMRKEMYGMYILAPHRAIEVVAIFRNTCKVNDTEVGRVTWPSISIPWRRFT